MCKCTKGSEKLRLTWMGGAGVQYTIDSVVTELATDPDRKFVQVETGFFWRWWSEQVKQGVKLLI